MAAGRTERAVDVGGMPVRVKVSPGRVKVEHDDAGRAVPAGVAAGQLRTAGGLWW